MASLFTLIYSRCRCSQLYVFLIFTLILMKIDGSQTPCKKPPGVCIVLPADDNGANYSHTADLIQQSVVSKTPNQTVAVGDDATFEIVVDLTNISDTFSNLSIAPYVGGCQVTGGKSPHCSPPTKRGSKLFQTCTFLAVTSHDSGKNIKYWIFSSQDPLLYVCQSASYLIVEAKPQPIEAVDYSVNPCSGVSFTFSSPSVNDTNVHIECRLYYHKTNESVLVHRNTDCTNNTVVPPGVFGDHSGNYSLVSQSVKTVAKGEEKIFSFTLGSKYLKLDIQKISIEFKDKNFFGEIFAKVNSCKLVNPNYVYIQSNCSEDKQLEEIPKDPQFNKNLVFFHNLQKEKRFCTFSIQDSVGGNTTQYQTDISTFFLQEVTVTVLHNDPRYVMIVCRFMSAGSVIVGCTLNMTSEYTSPLIYNITTNDVSSLVGVGVVGPLVPGTTYTIRVNEFVGEPDNTSGTLFTEIFQSIDPSTSSEGSIPAVSPTTPQYSAEPSSSNNDNIDNNVVGVGTAVLGAFMLILIIAVIALIVLEWKLYKNKQETYDVHNPGTLTARDMESVKKVKSDIEMEIVPPSNAAQDGSTKVNEESFTVEPAIESTLFGSHQPTAEANDEAFSSVYLTPRPQTNVLEEPAQNGSEGPVLYVLSRVSAGDKTDGHSVTEIFAHPEGVSEQQQKTDNEQYVEPATQNNKPNVSGSTTNQGEEDLLLKKPDVMEER